MKTKPSLWQMMVLLMFPQVAETIYSPALASISQSFAVTNAQAAQTLSVYFSALAIGVVVWGILADKWGRRPIMLLGLTIFACSAITAMQTESFTVLMLARATSAFGIAVGSVVTQTMLRDVFSGDELAKVFSFMGIGLSISPVVGMLLGGQLVHVGGHQAVFSALFALVMLVLIYNVKMLPETQQAKQPTQLKALGFKMLKDRQIWTSAMLVALYNIALFSYYQLGAFTFSELGLNAEMFGYSGVVLGSGTFLGSYLNKILLDKGFSQNTLLSVACGLLMFGSLGVLAMQHHIGFLLPMMLVVMAFGIAIPNVLSGALVDYRSQAGSAGAMLGLLYYLMIGSGLAVVGMVQNLGVSLVCCALIVAAITFTSKVRTRC
ncbi:multidrug effflux MFS transporter [Vibrio atlanticus]|uniref:Inner membrane transport protein YdhC n=1 Tax=Vibrio atlanticus TaxID=693153 RepID=A0A1C3ISM3_9VIBR|nr:multidrug effflux MFS transporter [Vibrio atlanticus]SBS64423.1 Inner membrane transport protein YdhC [Vibrio atlanticus]